MSQPCHLMKQLLPRAASPPPHGQPPLANLGSPTRTPRPSLPTPYPFWKIVSGIPSTRVPKIVPEPLRRSIDEHRRAFAGLFDACVPIDLTKPEDGFPDPNYGGEALKRTLLRFLPNAYR